MKTMKKITFITFCCIIICLLSLSCCRNFPILRGEGHLIEKRIEINTVKSIDSRGSFDIELIKSDSLAVIIHAQKNISEAIIIDIKQETAIIRYKSGLIIKPTESVKITFFIPELKIINLRGSGNIISKDTFKSTDFIAASIYGSGDLFLNLDCPESKICIKGSGNANLNLVSQQLQSSISGSGSINLNGSAQHHDIAIHGSGKIFAFDLENQQSDIKISGSGDVDVFSLEVLNVTISGSGNVRYKGHPRISTNISGSGNIYSW